MLNGFNNQTEVILIGNGFPLKNGNYECFLVYFPEPDETEVVEQMAELYVATNREHLTDVSEEHIKELKKVYVADVQAKRNFGKGKGQDKGKGK